MSRLLIPLVSACLLFPLPCSGDPLAAPAPAPIAELVGQWTVKFDNGVRQTCDIRRDGKASVVEPLRTSAGTAVRQGGSIVIRYQDDRAERWTPMGNRFIVEHWFPALQFPMGAAVLGDR
jgi:hypothetical protein